MRTMHGIRMRYVEVAAAGLLVGLLVAGTSVQTLLPFVVLLACPLMMIVMMRGMGHGGHGGPSAAPRESPGTDRGELADHAPGHRP
jgi:hypothetical protein